MKQRNIHKKFHYFYRIENIINNFYYYGIHSTDKLDDGYMGSGRELRRAQKIYGIENFFKTILKFFNTREECANYEALVVNKQCISDPMCYNIVLGGDTGLTYNTLLVIDKDGKYHRVVYNDERYLSGEYIPATTGKTSAYDKLLNKYVQVSVEEFHKNKNIRYIGCTYGKVTVKDNKNNYFSVSVNDERYLNGELVPVFTGMHHKPETIQKIKNTFKNNNHQSGKKNSQYNTMWIYNKETKENKKIQKSDFINYSDDWCEGRYIDSSKYSLKCEHLITVDKLLQLRKEKMTWVEISKYLGISRNAISRFRHKNNIFEETEKRVVYHKNKEKSDKVKQIYKYNDNNYINAERNERRKYNNYIDYLIEKLGDNNFHKIQYGQCHICGKYNCNDDFCKSINNSQFLMTLIKQYKLDPMKLGTNQIYDEINKIKENIKTLYDNGNNLTEISKILNVERRTLTNVIKRLNIL